MKALPMKSCKSLGTSYVPFIPDSSIESRILDETPYQVTVKDKMRYHSITFMKVNLFSSHLFA